MDAKTKELVSKIEEDKNTLTIVQKTISENNEILLNLNNNISQLNSEIKEKKKEHIYYEDSLSRIMRDIEIKEKDSKKNIQQIENNIKALGMSAAEGVFSSIGTGQIGAVYRDIIKREGVEAGSKIFRNGLIEAYKGALKKYGVPIGALGEGVEETATQITQNMISGKPAFEGAVDAFILGNGSGVVFTAPITSLNIV
jgi:DNA repair exonuclease SbcCD ATPase subunit